MRCSAPSSASEVTGENCTPLATLAATAISLASMIVSARPPTRATRGTAPYRSAQSWVNPQGFETRGHDDHIGAALDQVGQILVVA